MNCTKREKGLLGFSILLLLFYTFWGFVFTKTVFANSRIIYAFFVVLPILFALSLIMNRFIMIDSYSVLWFPFILYCMGGYILSGNIESFAYWSVCLLLLFLAKSKNICKNISYKFLLLSGIFIIIGQCVQLFLPNLYYSKIATLFINQDQILYWNNNYGLAGFTYQLDSTAITLLVSEAVLLYMFVFNRYEKRKVLNILFLIIIIVGIFLAGKRMVFIISIFIPTLIYLLTEKNSSKKVKRTLYIVVFLCLILVIFINNLQYFSNTRFFGRFARTFINLENSIDVTTGRNNLYKFALSAFYDHPVFGIGIGKFMSYTGSETAVHNTYLQILCEQGIIGLTLFLVPLIVILISTIVAVRKDYWEEKDKIYLKISLFLQLSYLLYGLTENVNINMFGFITYFIAVAMYISSREFLKNNRKYSG